MRLLCAVLLVGSAVVAQPTMEETFEGIQSATVGIQSHAVSMLLDAVLGKAPPPLTATTSPLQLDGNSSCSPPSANVARYFSDMFLSFGVRAAPCNCACVSNLQYCAAPLICRGCSVLSVRSAA
jgi:hypothetical protein